MGRASETQHSFNAGEVSPLLLGRQDLQKYGAMLAACYNAVVLAQGPWTRRSGTAFITQTKHHAKASRLMPFQFSITQTYVLEFGETYIRFFTQGGILTLATQAITGITKANPAVLTYSGADTYSNGDRVYVQDVVGMTQVNNREFVVANVNAGANTFELTDSDGANVDSTAYDTYTSGGVVGEIYEVVSPYDDTELASLRVVQSADTLYILHPSYAPRKLVRNSATSFTLSVIVFTDGPYATINQTTTTLSPSAATGTVTITASAATGINNNQGFLSTDVGRKIRMFEGTAWGYGTISAFTSTVAVTMIVEQTLTNTNAKINWRLGLWSDNTGFPRCGTFFEDRLVLGGQTGYPQYLALSKTQLYENYAPSAVDGTVANDNAIVVAMNSADVNGVRWIRDNERGLLVGTGRGEWWVKASTLGEALTPSNVSAKPSTRHGSEDIEPVNASRAVLFTQRAGRKVRELTYVFESDGFKAPDMTLLAEHITSPAIVETVYQEQPQGVMWARRSDGALLGFSYERDQEVSAWHLHELGGFSDAGATAIPVIESECVVPAADEDRDELYMIVKRYINGGTKRYVELMTKLWETTDDQEDAFYVDCGWTQTDSPATDTVTGLWHLEGQTVGVYVDGLRHPNETVTNGKITLDYTGLIKTVGYYYNSDGQTMPLDAGASDGSAQGKVKRVTRIGFTLVDTLGFFYGPDADNLTELLVRTWGAVYGEATPLSTGVFRAGLQGTFDRLGQVYWRADGPFPATVAALHQQVNTSDDS